MARGSSTPAPPTNGRSPAPARANEPAPSRAWPRPPRRSSRTKSTRRVGIGVDQPCRRAARAFILRGGMRRLDQPRLSLARDACAPRVLGGNGQGTPGGGVEITNLARDIEQRALRWQHRVAVPFVVGRATNVAWAGLVAMLGERVTRS